jgi:hypothetical protein
MTIPAIHIPRGFLRGFAVVVLAVVLAACSGDSTTANTHEQSVQSNQQTIYSQGEPVPIFPYSNYRQAMLQIETQLATGSPTTWTTWQSYSGVPEGVCKSWGWPLPVSTQLSNPVQSEYNTQGSDGIAGVALGQQEPTGIYSGQGLGTWVLCIGADNQPHPAYVEAVVNTFPYPVAIQDGRFVQTGDAAAETAIKPCNPTTKTCPKTTP